MSRSSSTRSCSSFETPEGLCSRNGLGCSSLPPGAAAIIDNEGQKKPTGGEPQTGARAPAALAFQRDEAAVSAVVVDERLATADNHLDHAAEDDAVAVALDDLFHLAIDGGQCPHQYGSAA